MTVMAIMPVRNLNLVAPLAHKAADRCVTDTAGCGLDRSCTAFPMIDACLRRGGMDSAIRRSTRPTTHGFRTSMMATRTSTTRTTPIGRVPSADSEAAATLEDLVIAYLDCCRHKRGTDSALAFDLQLERNLTGLHADLVSGLYRPGRSICFVVTRPKPREVWAADFRDRIVHHLLYNKVGPRFEAGFIADSCACIAGRGTLYAANRLEHHVRSVTQNWNKPAWYLKCDLANFFVAIKKPVLRKQLLEKIPEAWWKNLTETILFHDPRLDVDVRCPPALLRLVPPHKSLFNAPANTGLPIGNLSSQFFANVYLNALDQHAKHSLRARRYVRYVDDFIMLHESTSWLSAALADITQFLPERLHARLNPTKTILQRIDRGIDFVGHIIKPWRRTTRPRTLNVAMRRIEHMAEPDVYATANSYFGLLRQASHSHTDRTRLANALRKRGRTISGDLTKIYRSQHD